MWRADDGQARDISTTHVQNPYDPLVNVPGPDAFAQITAPNTHGVTWARELPDAVTTWLAGLATQQLPQARMLLAITDVEAAVRQCLEKANIAPTPASAWLIDDVSQLATAFGRLMSVSTIRLRFDVIDDAGCPKFHQDAVPARLLCTYRGAGTQYRLEPRGSGPRNDSGQQVRPHRQSQRRTLTPPRAPALHPAGTRSVFSAQTGAALVMRGTHWPTHGQSRLCHRSPPADPSGMARFLLAIDPIGSSPDTGVSTQR